MDYSIAIFRFWGDFCCVEPDFQVTVFYTLLLRLLFVTSADRTTMRLVDVYALSLTYYPFRFFLILPFISLPLTRKDTATIQLSHLSSHQFRK